MMILDWTLFLLEIEIIFTLKVARVRKSKKENTDFSKNKIYSRQMNFRAVERGIDFFFKAQNPHREEKKLLNINLH